MSARRPTVRPLASAAAPDDRDDSGLADAGVMLDAERFEAVGDDLRGPVLLEAQLGMHVEIAAQAPRIRRARRKCAQQDWSWRRFSGPLAGNIALDAQARVHRVVHEIDDEVDEDEHQGNEAKIRRHDGDVSEVDRLDEQKPHPGHWKTVSVTMANAMMPPSCRPVMVMTGTSVFLSAWPKWIARSVSPRARANLM
jgi:hypothetical protein